MSSESQKAVEQINAALPVLLGTDDVEQAPEFTKLLRRLSQHITKDGASLHVNTDLDEARRVLRQARRGWLEKQVLYKELQELILDHQLEDVKRSPTPASQFYTAVGDMLTMTEIPDYLSCHPDPSSDLTLFGLTRDDVDRRNPHKRHLQSIQQRLIPEIEARLRKKCEGLVGFHHSCSNVTSIAESSNLMFAKASQLPSILESEQRHLVEETKLLQQDKASRDKQLNIYFQTLMESLETLESLISKHRLRSQAHSDTVTTEWLAARCDAMCVKVRCLELELLCDTYYADTIQALATIRRELDGAVADTEEELQQARQALRAYEAVGMGFNELVEQYTTIKQEVDNKRWALREMRKHDTSDLFS